jgi:hypothetical protein
VLTDAGGTKVAARATEIESANTGSRIPSQTVSSQIRSRPTLSGQL